MNNIQTQGKWYVGMDGTGDTQVLSSKNPPAKSDVMGFWLAGLSFMAVFGPFDTEQDAEAFSPDELYETQDSSAMLTGKDYPELCEICRSAIDACVSMIGEMPGDWTDEEDTELACNLAYDLRMFCGKHECINKPQTHRVF